MSIRKAALEMTIGKTITHVIVSHTGRESQNLFLVFSDNTYIEIYSPELHTGSWVYDGDFERALHSARQLGDRKMILPEQAGQS